MLYQREPVIRLTRPTDINAVTMMDLKCYPYPLEMKQWQELLSGSGKQNHARVVVVEAKGVAVGFAVWSIRQENMVGLLHRLGVLPQYRRRQFGTLLMAAYIKHCQENQCDKVRVIVPSIHCDPGDPDDVSAFLNTCGFKTTGEILPDYRVMYGDEVDGYVFERGTHAITR